MKIKNRMFYRIPVELISPLSISAGESSLSDLTDHDIIMTEDEKPFIPGSSIAGAVREYIGKSCRESCESLFGKSLTHADEEPSMSRIIFSDLVFDSDRTVSVRDGIALKEEQKTTEDTGKFDYQIIETHAKGTLFIECVLYDKKDEADSEKVDLIIRDAIKGMNNGEIRFGFKKNRGLGRVKVEKLYSKIFNFSTNDGSTAEKYLSFCEDIYNDENYKNEEIATETDDIDENNAKIIMNLSLTGGISIRTYSAVPNDPDFSQLTIKKTNGSGEIKNIPVIPGSSWNGAIRARTFDILKNELGIPDEKKVKLKEELDKFWGKLGEKDFQASKIIFSESQIKGAKPVKMTRNKINRFDASTCDGALYSELSYFGGNTKLEIMIKDYNEHLWCIWLVHLALEDLKNGLLSVGGQTAVGRGIFHGEKEEKCINFDMEDARSALVRKIKEGE